MHVTAYDKIVQYHWHTIQWVVVENIVIKNTFFFERAVPVVLHILNLLQQTIQAVHNIKNFQSIF